MSRVKTRRWLQSRVGCSQFNVSLSIGEILAYGYDSVHASRACPFNNFSPISVENRVAQVGMRIYNSMIRKSQYLILVLTIIYSGSADCFRKPQV